MLFYTEVTRSSTPILTEQSAKLHTERRLVDLSIQMATLAGQLKDEIQNESVAPIGELLHENWTRKKELSGGISNDRIDGWYKEALRAGALGGKIAGAGGGGFLYLFAPPNRHEAIKNAVGLRHIPFRITTTGSRVVYMEGMNDAD